MRMYTNIERGDFCFTQKISFSHRNDTNHSKKSWRAMWQDRKTSHILIKQLHFLNLKHCDLQKTMTCRFKYKYLYPTYFQKGFQADYSNINTKPRQVEVIFWIICHSGLTVTLAPLKLAWTVRSWLYGKVAKTWKELLKGIFAISYKANDGDEKRATTRFIWTHAAE